MKKMFRAFFWSDEEKSIRGCFIAAVTTLVYVVLLILGAIFSFIADNIAKMETFLIGFYTISFGVWTGKKVYEYSKMSGVNDILKKFGTTLDEVKVLKKNGNGDAITPDSDAAARAAEREAAK